MKKINRIIIAYLIFGFLWIYLGDLLLFSVVEDQSTLQVIGNYKGYIFVVISATLLLIVLRKAYLNMLEQKQKIDLLLSNPDIGFIEVSGSGDIMDISANVAQKLGYNRKELLGSTTRKITYPEDLKEDRYMWELFRQDSSLSFTREKRYLHRNGTIIWYKLIGTLAKDKNGHPYFIAALNDISKKKDTDDFIKNQLKEKEVIINSTDDLIWSLDSGMKLKAFNDAFVNFAAAKYNTRPKAGEDILSIYNNENEKMIFLNGYLKALNNEKITITKKETINNREKYYKITFCPLSVDDKMSGIVCFAKDITEEKIQIKKLQSAQGI